MDIAYGIDIRPDGDPYVDAAVKALAALSTAAVPGKYWVDIIPWGTYHIRLYLSASRSRLTLLIVKYIPSWFPGAGFKKEANAWKQMTDNMIDLPYAAVKQEIVTRFVIITFTRLTYDA